MKTRRHHNNKGLRQIKRGKTRRQVACMAARLGIPFEHERRKPHEQKNHCPQTS